MEVGTYVEKALTSELSGNIIDLCPVGALTSKPYAFNARPWELTKTETIDVMDAVGSNIRVDSRGGEVQRVIPLLNEDINEEWISDKARFACDGLRRQRLDTPYVRKDGKLAPASWADALAAAADGFGKAGPKRIAAIAGDLADCESMAMLKDLFAALGSPHVDSRQEGAKFTAGARAGYLFNTSIAGIEEADACLIVGADPRREAPLVNARIRKRHSMGGFRVALIGEAVDLAYGYDHLGNEAKLLADIAAGNHDFSAVLEAAERPMIVLGEAAFARADGARILGTARALAERCGMAGEGWNGFSVLHRAAARVGALDLGLVPGESGRDVAGILAGRRKRRDRSGLSARRRRDRHRPARRRLRGLSGPSRRCRGDARRRDPAGRRLYREGSDLRQPRGPGAAHRPRGAPAGRGARGLAHPARAVGAHGHAAPLRHLGSRRCARGWRKSPRSSPEPVRSSAPPGRLSARTGRPMPGRSAPSSATTT